MANPKRRHSNHRSRTRRSHHAIDVKSASKCVNCGAATMPHRVCMKCGHYRGRQVITIRVKEDKKQEN